MNIGSNEEIGKSVLKSGNTPAACFLLCLVGAVRLYIIRRQMGKKRRHRKLFNDSLVTCFFYEINYRRELIGKQNRCIAH
jgi:hypothetical protein